MRRITTKIWQICIPGGRSLWYLRVQLCGGNLTGEIPLRSEGGFGVRKSYEDEGWYSGLQSVHPLVNKHYLGTYYVLGILPHDMQR